MADISCNIAVVGAGVLGLCVAAELSLRGHDVRVIDPGGSNASSVAAGMIAPAFESFLDCADAERAILLRDAAALWTAFAERTGVSLDTTPAEWRGPDSKGVAARLEAHGFPVKIVDDRVRAESDIRVDAVTTMTALAAQLSHPVLAASAHLLLPDGDTWRIRTSDGEVAASHLVLATGTAEALPGLPAEIAALVRTIQPIAGQIGRVDQPTGASVLRGPDGYVVADLSGLLIGATMVVGSRDMSPDAGASRRLTASAEGLLGRQLASPVLWAAGIRGATADGLPMAGPTRTPGLHLALAPRRNGWLLGPLVGRTVADGIEGRPPGAHAAALNPLRFSPQAR